MTKVCGALVFLALTFAAAHVRADGALAEQRDRLVGVVEGQRAALGPGRDYRLYLDEGADQRELLLMLHQRGGAWRAGWAEVPGFAPSTMQEWRSYYLGNGGGNHRNIMRFGVDTTGLGVRGDGLGGEATVTLRLDQTLEEKHPAGVHVSWWDRFIPSGMTVPRKQTYALDAMVAKDGYLFELEIDGGVYWDGAWSQAKRDKQGNVVSKPAGVVRWPIQVRLQVPSTRFTVTRVQTPNWNGGYHEGDATGLTFADGKLSGRLLVMLHQDGWVPFGGGKTTRHDPLIVRFDIEATLKHHEVSGTYKATMSGQYEGLHYQRGGGESMKTEIPETTYAGEIRGVGGRAVLGRYSARGELREHAGGITGMLLEESRGLREVFADGGGDALAKTNRLLHQIRALRLMQRVDTLSAAEALAQTDIVDAVQVPDVAKYGERATQLMAGEGKLEPWKAENPDDSPSLGVVAMASKDGSNILPTEGWAYATAWQVLGPLNQRDGLDNNENSAMEIVPIAGATYAQRENVGKTVSWVAVSADSSRVALPEQDVGFYTRAVHQLWFAQTRITSDKARMANLAVEANDFAKCWVNGKLVWVDEEKHYRYRARGRTVVPVALEAGENEVVFRVHRDRRVSWLRVALGGKNAVEQQRGEMPQQVLNPHIYRDATPPLAWDLDKGINVAWREEAYGGGTRPVVWGDALLVTSGSNRLHCVDAATGRERWAAEIGGVDGSKDAAIYVPIVLRDRIYAHGSSGTLACVDASGKVAWTVETKLGRARVHGWDRTIVVHGMISGDWPNVKIDPKAKERPSGVLIVNADSGKVEHQQVIEDRFHESLSQLVILRNGSEESPVLVAGARYLLDVAAKRLIGPLDVDLPPGAGSPGGAAGYGAAKACGFSFNAEGIFWTTQEQSAGLRLWRAKDGRIGYGHRWESNYEHGGFGSFYMPCLATEKLLFTWSPVLERGPHCPNPRLELTVQDAATGRPLNRLKPALEGVLHAINPVIAGRYILCSDSGGGPFAPMQTHGQLLIATADEQLQAINRNLIEVGTKAAPVAAGNRLFLRGPKSLACIEVKTEEGRRYQTQQVARTALIAIGGDPRSSRMRAIAPLAGLAPSAKRPVGKLQDGRATDAWVGAGPFTGAVDQATLAALRPEIGSTARLGDREVTFAALNREQAYNEPPMFLRVFELQGTGDLVPNFLTVVDPRAVSGPQGAGVISTVLDNPRDRVVAPMLKGQGLTLWLNGEKIGPEETLRLKPGLYAFTVLIEPSYYAAPEKKTSTPIAVGRALAEKAIDAVAWPKSWQVIGPIAPDAPGVEEEQLKAVPTKMTLGDQTLEAFEFPATRGGGKKDGAADTVVLTPLVDLAPGQKPDVAKPPASVKIAVPASVLAFAEVEAPGDGYLYISAAADWHMTWYVDGKQVYDTGEKGNNAAATDVNAHPFAVKVTKGKHVVAVQVRPGSAGWSFSSIAGFSDKSPEQLDDYRVQPKQGPVVRDLRMVPGFKEVPNPMLREVRWKDAIRRARMQLEAAVGDLPDTAEGRTAAMLLKELR